MSAPELKIQPGNGHGLTTAVQPKRPKRVCQQSLEASTIQLCNHFCTPLYFALSLEKIHSERNENTLLFSFLGDHHCRGKQHGRIG